MVNKTNINPMMYPNTVISRHQISAEDHVENLQDFSHDANSCTTSEQYVSHDENEECDEQRYYERESKPKPFDNTTRSVDESQHNKGENTICKSEPQPTVSKFFSGNENMGKETMIVDIHDDDVLCGRGAGMHQHPGNKKFRELVHQYQPLYASVNVLEKSEIASGIVHGVGRFLRQKGDSWYNIGEKAAKEKTCQALREKQSERNLSPPFRKKLHSRPQLNKKEVDNGNDVINVQDNDVLLGRGGVTNSHVGNVRFRNLVHEFQPKYLSSAKKMKRLVAKEIVTLVQSRGGRFLICMSDVWKEVNDQRAREKTSQALRENAPAIRQIMNASRFCSTHQMPLCQQDMRYRQQDFPPISLRYQGELKNQIRFPSKTLQHDPFNKDYNRCTIAQYDRQYLYDVTKPLHQQQATTYQVCARDVLFGRGTGINNHPGNVYFRNLVQRHQQVYASAPKVQKTKITMHITALIHSCGGRFLNHLRGGGWTILSLENVTDKVSQALREKTSHSH